MTDLPTYELYAIRYATRDGRRAENFIGGDPHDGPMPMDYYVWAAVGPGGPFIIDVGFTEEMARKRKRTFLRDPVEAFSLVGVDASTVKDVIITHLHYDHIGNFDKFPAAKFHLQEQEMAYATGPYMKYHALNHSFEIEDVLGVVRLNFGGRIVFHKGQSALTPGLILEFSGGHSEGLQFVRVHTKRGWVVLASDVSHYYENMDSERPYVTALHVGEMLRGFDRLRAAAESEKHIIPGHDPLVMKRFPPPRPDLEGIAVRLDLEPLERNWPSNEPPGR